MCLPYQHAGGVMGASPLLWGQIAALRHRATAMKGKARGYTRAQRPKSARPALGGPNRSWALRDNSWLVLLNALPECLRPLDR